MYALEQEPEKGGRLKRFGVGIGVVIAIFLGLVFGSRNIVPAARALTEVVQLNVIDEPELPKPEDAPPPPPPPPTEAPKPKKREPSAVPAPPDAPPPPSDAPPAVDQVGLDADSFGTGSGGPAFAMGTTQMGAPSAPRGTTAPAIEEQPLKPKPQIIEARPLASNGLPKYIDRARKLGIQGLMVIEADIDATGKVTRALVRGKLNPQLDAMARETVLGWRFDPATLAGRAVPSTKFLRIRFQLE